MKITNVEPILLRGEQSYRATQGAGEAVDNGDWQLLECVPAWEDNWTAECFVAWLWTSSAGDRRLVAVNYAANQSQCYVRLPFADIGNGQWRLKDLLGDATYDREGKDLSDRGLYLDEAAWKTSVFSLTSASKYEEGRSTKAGSY